MSGKRAPSEVQAMMRLSRGAILTISGQRTEDDEEVTTAITFDVQQPHEEQTGMRLSQFYCWNMQREEVVKLRDALTIWLHAAEVWEGKDG